MDAESSSQSEPSTRTTQACEPCRLKRARCSGNKPCERCLLAGASDRCIYGFSRGERRANLLSAINEHQSRQTTGGTTQINLSPIASKATAPSGGESLSLSPLSPKSITLGHDVPNGDEDSQMSTEEATSSSLASPVESASTRPKVKAKTKAQAKASASTHDSRKSRISSACLECKKRRRKCNGLQPCQTCQDFECDCVYDPGGDRRSKAYFQRRLAEGIRDAAHADPGDDLVAALQKNIDPSDGRSEEVPLTMASGLSFEHSPNEAAQDVHPARLRCSALCTLSAKGASPRAAWYPAYLQEQQEHRLQGPHHLICPHVVSDDSPLSMAFVNFREGLNQMLTQGTPFEWAVGPLDTRVDLIFRDRNLEDPFCASTMACELSRIIHPHDVFTQLANAYLLARYMRWIISPTLENFLYLPQIMRPTEGQQTIPHYASADLYPIPAVRDCLLKGGMSLLEAIGLEGTVGIRFHWPFEMNKAITTHPETGSLTTTRLFQICVEESANWSCGRDFLQGAIARGLMNTIDHQHHWQMAQTGLKIAT